MARRALAAVCKGLFSIEESGLKRAFEMARSAMLEKAFGVPFKEAGSLQEAEQLGRALVTRPRTGTRRAASSHPWLNPHHQMPGLNKWVRLATVLHPTP
ncbi:MAG: hypothetical protein P8Y58_01935 [Novosphingobium sp.]